MTFDTPPQRPMPEPFHDAVTAMRAIAAPPGVDSQEVTPPRGLAPFAHAWSATGSRGRVDGRLIVLHDPGGHPAWDGDTRLVAYVSVPANAVAGEPRALAARLWWRLGHALDSRAAGYTAAAGTVTHRLSVRFGDLALPEPDDSDDMVELRASWTPRDRQLHRHLTAWYGLLGRVG